MRTKRNDVSASNAKSARKENVKANANRVGLRQKSDIPTDKSKDIIVNNALKEHPHHYNMRKSRSVQLPARIILWGMVGS